MTFSKLSFKRQFYATLFTAGSIAIVAGFLFNVYSSYIYKKEAFTQESLLQAGLIADNSVAPLMFFDQDGIKQSLAQLYHYKDILQVTVYNNNDEIFARYNPKNRENAKDYNKKLSIFLIDDDSLVFKYDVVDNGVNYGTVYLEKSTSTLKDFLYNSLVNTILFSLVLLLLMIVSVVKMSHIFIAPIVSLSDTLSELSKSQNYNTRLHYDGDGKNEISNLYSSFNNLFISIGIHEKSKDQALKKAQSAQQHLERLTDELENRVEDRTKELQDSIHTLKTAQSQLVESEKMVALGSLVSGVAHEVNTPLGNAVTGSSIIKGDCKALLDMINDGSLKKSVLYSKIEHIEETSRLLFKSITTAADLIKSFKQISVDQSLELQREFNLEVYINEGHL